MPKLLDYPRGSLKSALDLADAVDALGGEASMGMAADKMGRKVSGAFNALMSSASKYGLIDTKSQKITVTQLYRDYRLAYTPDEANLALRTALLKPPIFQGIVDRFLGKELPISHFEKLLEREFEVPNDWASRVASYFIDGARQVGLLGEGNKVIDLTSTILPPLPQAPDIELDVENIQAVSSPSTPADLAKPLMQYTDNSGRTAYVITITGPGINTTIQIQDNDDFAILQATLRKVEKTITQTT